MKYLIVQQYDLDKMNKAVQKYLDDGWHLQGGVSLAVKYDNLETYAQALIKDEQ